MSLILHLSDPHFGTERHPVCCALMALAYRLRPDAIVISGDITQRATVEQFDAAARFIDSLPEVPRLVLPGNHDIPLYNPALRLFAPYRRFQARFGAHDDRHLDLPGIQISGVDSSRFWRQQSGALSTSQIERVAQRLKAAPPGTWRIVVTHHPLQLTPGANRLDLPLGHEAALHRWCVAGADLFLNGHIHRATLLPVIGGGSAQRPVFMSQAGTACSARLRGGMPNSVTVLRQQNQGAAPQRTLEHWHWSEHSRRFESAGRIPLDGIEKQASPLLTAVQRARA